MKKIIIGIILGLFLSFNWTKAQIDTTVRLVSKVDNDKQFELWDGTETMLMGYTKLLGESINLPSPVLYFNEGDSVELKLKNFSQGAPHTIHLHGLDVDQQNDGVPHLSFTVEHSEEGSYFFKAPHPGTYLYHCHVVSSIHVQAGMYGLLVVKPSSGLNETWENGFEYYKEYAWLSSEIDTNWHTEEFIHHQYDDNQQEHILPDYAPQYFLINGKSEQQLSDSLTEIQTIANTNTYLRLANIGYFGNRIIIPSELNAKIVSSDGRPLPSIEVSDTVELLPGERYGVILSPTEELMDSIKVEYFNLNTELIHSVQSVAISVDGFLSTEETTVRKTLSIYPNPAIDFISVNSSETIEYIIIYDITGKLLLSHYNVGKQKIISTSNWPNGSYQILVRENEQIHSKTIIIKR